jgi:hypothetical protein
MNKDEFSQQLKARQDEITEMESMVQDYAYSIKHNQAMIKASMIIAYRKGVIDMLDYLDKKAIASKKAKDKINDILKETRE